MVHSYDNYDTRFSQELRQWRDEKKSGFDLFSTRMEFGSQFFTWRKFCFLASYRFQRREEDFLEDLFILGTFPENSEFSLFIFLVFALEDLFIFGTFPENSEFAVFNRGFVYFWSFPEKIQSLHFAVFCF